MLHELSALLKVFRTKYSDNISVHAMHLLRKTAVLAIDAANASQRALSHLRIRTMVTIDAVKLHAGGALLAHRLSSDDTKPLEIILGQLGVMLVRTVAIAAIPVTAAAANVVLIAVLHLLELVDTIMIVLHVSVYTVAVLVLADDWTCGDLDL